MLNKNQLPDDTDTDFENEAEAQDDLRAVQTSDDIDEPNPEADDLGPTSGALEQAEIDKPEPKTDK